MRGQQQQDHHGGEAAHHIPQHQVGGPPPILGGIDRRGGARGDGGVEDFCGRGEEEFARGKRPGGAVLLKTLRGCSRKVKVRCLQIICLFMSRIWFFTSKIANVIRATSRNMLSAKFQ